MTASLADVSISWSRASGSITLTAPGVRPFTELVSVATAMTTVLTAVVGFLLMVVVKVSKVRYSLFVPIYFRLSTKPIYEYSNRGAVGLP